MKTACTPSKCAYICISVYNPSSDTSGESKCLCPLPVLNATVQNEDCSAPKSSLLDEPVDCRCANGAKCKNDGTCVCIGGDSGTACDVGGPESERVAQGSSNIALPVVLTLVVLALLIGIIVTIVYLHKERKLFFKKKTAAGTDSVSYHGNVVSFTNPVMEHNENERGMVCVGCDSPRSLHQSTEYTLDQLARVAITPTNTDLDAATSSGFNSRTSTLSTARVGDGERYSPHSSPTFVNPGYEMERKVAPSTTSDFDDSECD